MVTNPSEELEGQRKYNSLNIHDRLLKVLSSTMISPKEIKHTQLKVRSKNDLKKSFKVCVRRKNIRI